MPEPFSQSTVYLLHQLVERLDDAASELIPAETGLTFSEFVLLTMVAEAPNCNHEHLARRLSLSAASISLRVKSLVQNGYLAQNQNPSNRKEVFVSFTPLGTQVFETTAGILQGQFEHLFETLGAAQGAFRESLRALLARLDEKAGVHQPRKPSPA